jgi:outer membrane protein assembly factor BamE (lipoprotein component of BamABCDE complex)
MRDAIAGLVLAVLVAGCTTAPDQQRPSSSTERQMTLGVVQKEIRAGLTQDQVITGLGSPNIVTRDASGRETWVYDKVASEASYSNSAAYGTVLLLGAGTATGSANQSQRTLTVVIKFGADQRVETFSYHASRF